MGIEGSTENSSKPKVEFRFLRNETHRRYGQVKLYVQDKTNRVFIASEHVANEKIALKKTLEFAEFRVVQNHPAIQRMGGFMKLQNDAACGGYFKVSLLFEYIDYDLLDEIEKRKPSLNLVDEPELARILATVIDAGLHYQKTNQTHGNISPVNILIGEMKQFKLRDPELCGGTQLENMLRGADPTVGCYLSPQQMEAWKLNKPAGYNQLKSDVFALGMTMLHVASLQDVPRLCYDIPKRLINFSRVNEILDSIEHKYSQPFVFVLRKMLNSDEVSRPDFLLLRELAKDLRYPDDNQNRVIVTRSPTYFAQSNPVLARRSIPSPNDPTYFDRNDRDDRYDRAQNLLPELINRGSELGRMSVSPYRADEY